MDGRIAIVVDKDDTLGSIAKFYFGNASFYEHLARINKLDPHMPLQPGQRLYFS